MASVKIYPYQPNTFVSPPAVHERNAPSQSVARTADLPGHVRPAEPLPWSAKALKYAESLLAKEAESATRDLRDPRANKALAAYSGVANNSEREYVSRLFGFDDFA